MSTNHTYTFTKTAIQEIGLNLDSSEEKKDILNRLQNLHRNSTNIKTLVAEYGHGYRYRHAYELRDGKTSIAKLKIDPLQEARAAFMNIQFAPASLTADALKKIDEHLKILCGAKVGVMMRQSRLTFLKVCTDVENLALDDLLIVLPRKRELEIRKEILDNQARVVSIEFGACASDRRFSALQINGGSATSDRTGVRFEAAWKLRGISVEDLLQTLNFFSEVSMISMPALRAAGVSALFLDSCRYRGVQSALALCKSAGRRKKYGRLVARNRVDWWKPAKLWGNLEVELEAIGLLGVDGV